MTGRLRVGRAGSPLPAVARRGLRALRARSEATFSFDHVDSSRVILPAGANSPDGAVAVFADEQAAIFRDRDSDRATTDFDVRRDEDGHEIFIFATRFDGRLVERYAHHLDASTFME